MENTKLQEFQVFIEFSSFLFHAPPPSPQSSPSLLNPSLAPLPTSLIPPLIPLQSILPNPIQSLVLLLTFFDPHPRL